MKRPRLTPRAARRAYLVALVALCLIVLTGAAVRLTQSGLGCPDWPTCTAHRLVAAWQYHAAIEFGNRVVTVAVTLAVLAALGAAWLQVPRRADLLWLSAGTVAGVVAQAVLGGITVLAKLSPPWVMAHFLLSMAVVAVGAALVDRSRRPAGRRQPVVTGRLLMTSRAMVALSAVVLGLGTVVTGSGPHSGGVDVARLPLPARDAAELHSTAVVLLVGLTLGVLLLLRPAGAPAAVEARGRVLLYVMVAQGAVGYTQYLTGVPAALVEIHVAGALAVWLAVLRFHWSLRRTPTGGDEPAPSVASASDPVVASAEQVVAALGGAPAQAGAPS
ncbi:MAG TPA: COX15/CtaA family protein [Acidimicrobiales bacterium]|nr:COX15/CtaA family protein [Acidimicrobiales bacterium]